MGDGVNDIVTTRVLRVLQRGAFSAVEAWAPATTAPRSLVTDADTLGERWPTFEHEARRALWREHAWMYEPTWQAHDPPHTAGRCKRCAVAQAHAAGVLARPPLVVRDAWGVIGLEVHDTDINAPFGDTPLPMRERIAVLPWATPLAVVDTETGQAVPDTAGPWGDPRAFAWEAAPIGPRTASWRTDAVYQRVARFAAVKEDHAQQVAQALKDYAHEQQRMLIWYSARVRLPAVGRVDDGFGHWTETIGALGFTRFGA